MMHQDKITGGTRARFCIRAEVLLAVATVCKAVLVLAFYQHVITTERGVPVLVRDYGWSELVSSMGEGRYEMVAQTGLSDIYDLRSAAYRPPVYPLFLFAATWSGKYTAVIIVFLQSVITSLVAYLGYRITLISSGRQGLSSLCLWSLFFFPMNFLKSGSTDESPLMLLFLLSAVYLFCKCGVGRNGSGALLFLSGIFLGLSTMTRYTVLPVALGMGLYLLVARPVVPSCSRALLFLAGYGCIVAPWIVRNDVLYGRPVLSVGGARLLLVTQSEEFISSFPYESPDTIERRYLRSFQEAHPYLSTLDSFALDREFKYYARRVALSEPKRFIRSIIAKLKVFLPFRYYPADRRGFGGKDLMYLSWYLPTLLVFLWTLVCRRTRREAAIVLIAIGGLASSAVICFMLSRHFHPLISLMIVFSCMAQPAPLQVDEPRHEECATLKKARGYA